MPDNRYSTNHLQRTPTANPAANPATRKPRQGCGCVCEGGPVIAATWRRGDLSVALEHAWDCPIPNVAMDPGVYAATGQRVPVEDSHADR